MSSLMLGFICCLILLQAGHAQRLRTWVGGSGDWSLANNWNPSVPPLDPMDDYLITNGGTVTVTQPAVFRMLTIQNATLSIQTSGIRGRSVLNNGTITTSGACGLDGNITNMGWLNLPSAQLMINGSIDNAPSGVVQWGMGSSSEINTQGNCDLFNAGKFLADFNIFAGQAYCTFTNRNSGALNVTGDLSITKYFENNGIVSLKATSTLTFYGGVLSSGRIDGGSLNFFSGQAEFTAASRVTGGSVKFYVPVLFRGNVTTSSVDIDISSDFTATQWTVDPNQHVKIDQRYNSAAYVRVNGIVILGTAEIAYARVHSNITLLPGSAVEGTDLLLNGTLTVQTTAEFTVSNVSGTFSPLPFGSCSISNNGNFTALGSLSISDCRFDNIGTANVYLHEDLTVSSSTASCSNTGTISMLNTDQILRFSCPLFERGTIRATTSDSNNTVILDHGSISLGPDSTFDVPSVEVRQHINVMGCTLTGNLTCADGVEFYIDIHQGAVGPTFTMNDLKLTDSTFLLFELSLASDQPVLVCYSTVLRGTAVVSYSNYVPLAGTYYLLYAYVRNGTFASFQPATPGSQLSYSDPKYVNLTIPVSTTQAVTTQAITTLAATTQAVTTMQIASTSVQTSAAQTTGQIATTKPATTAAVTTQLVTTQSFSTQSFTTQDVTTVVVVSTSPTSTTNLPTTAQFSTSPVTTSQQTTGDASTTNQAASTTAEITTTLRPTLSPSTTRDITTEVVTTSAITTATQDSSTSDNASSSSSSAGASSALIGGVIGGVVALMACAALAIFFVIRRRKQRNARNPEQDEMESVPLPSNASAPSLSNSTSNASVPSSRNTTGNTSKSGRVSVILDIPEVQQVKIGRKLGAGNFGEVFKGVAWGHTPVALKKLTADVAEDFLAEASILTRVKHPNCVLLLGVHTSPSGEQYMVTEFVEKGSVQSYLEQNRGNLPVSARIKMMLDAAKGMSYLSSQKIVHRDLSARNLLIDSKDNVKVADFGLSKRTEGSYYQSSASKFPIRWSAPEVLKYHKFSTYSDVWSFGITAYEIITFGRVPYAAMSNDDVITRVGDEGYRMPKPPECPEDLWALVLRCLAENPSDRPSFTQLASELTVLLKTHRANEGLPDLENDSDDDGAQNTSPNAKDAYNKTPMASGNESADSYAKTPKVDYANTKLEQ